MFQGSKPALFGMGMKLSIMDQNILAAVMQLVKQSRIDPKLEVLKPASTSIMNKLQKKRKLALIVGRKSNGAKD